MTGQTEEPLQEGKSIDLYPLPEDWKWGIVSDAGAQKKNAIVDGPFGSNLKVRDYVEGGPVPVLTTKNLEGKYDDVRYITKEKFEELKRSAVYPGDILMAKIGSCGKTGIYPPNNPPAMIPANLLKVSLNDRFELKYVYYYFNSSFFQKALRTITKATAQPAFGVTNFRKLPLPYTTRDQQKRIVAEIEKQFSRLDEAVGNLKRVKANLKRYKAAVLKAAVEGKLTEEWRKHHPNVEPASKLLERILAERRAKWSGSGKYKEPAKPDTTNIPLLPEGWTWATVEQLSMRVQYGSSVKTHEEAKGVPILRMANIEDGRLLLGLLKYLPKNHDEFPELLLREGDILFNRTNSAELVGKTAVYKGKPNPCSFASYLIRVRLVQGCAPDLLAYFINSAFGRAWIAQVVSQQVGQANVNGTKLQALAVPLSPFGEQEQIVAEVERRLSVIDELEATIDANLTRADRLRQSVLSQAFSGRLLERNRKHIPEILPALSIAAESQARYGRDDRARR